MRKLRYMMAAAMTVCLLGFFNRIEATATGVNTALEVNVDGSALYFDTIDDNDVPAGYAKSTMQYNGYGISSLVSSDGETILVKLSDASGENGSLYQYYEEDGSYKFSPFIHINGAGSYLLIKEAPGDVNIPDNYEQTTIEIDGHEVTAWMEKLGMSEFYLVYGVNQNDTEGLYNYDSREGAFLRYAEVDKNELDAANQQSSWLEGELSKQHGEFQENQDLLMKVIWGLCGVAGLLFLLMLLFMIKSSKWKRKSKEKDVIAKPYAENERKEDAPRVTKRRDMDKKKKKKDKKKEDEYDLDEELEDFEDTQSTIDIAAKIEKELNAEAEDKPIKANQDIKAFIPEEQELEELHFIDEPTEDIPPLPAESEKQDPVQMESAAEQEPSVLEPQPEILQPEVKPEPEVTEKEQIDVDFDDYDDFELEILDLDDE